MSNNLDCQGGHWGGHGWMHKQQTGSWTAISHHVKVGLTKREDINKNPKNLDTGNTVVIILKFEQRGFTIEKCVQKM